jgi:hypothetical protein
MIKIYEDSKKSGFDICPVLYNYNIFHQISEEIK